MKIAGINLFKKLEEIIYILNNGFFITLLNKVESQIKMH